jgi:hypothetical protein
MASLVLLPFALLVIGWYRWQKSRKDNSFYQSVPFVGVREGEWFAWTRAQLRSFSKTEEWMNEGYQKASNTFYKDKKQMD